MKQKRRHTQRGEVQKQKLVDAAYDIIAEEGFEGLRTREVAARARLNISTLHYYFASKEDLVRSVARRLLAEFKEGRESAQAQEPAGRGAVMESLRASFTDQNRVIQKRPATYVVVMELFTRSLHDRTMGPVVQELLKTWEEHFTSLVTEGVRAGQISSRSDVSTTVRALQGLLLGRAMLTLITGAEAEPEAMFREVSRWLKGHGGSGGTSAS